MRNGNQFDASQWTVAKALQKGGYNTAVIGKWHLKSDPVGFDHWEVLPGQGNYYNPVFLQQDGSKKRFEGYATDVTTEKALAWLDSRRRFQTVLSDVPTQGTASHVRARDSAPWIIR